MTELGPDVSSAPARRRPGGRSARVTQSVLRETLEAFAADGWAGVQIDAIAERAGVHKTTIYRRWPTRGALIAAALAAAPFRAHGAASPDTGSVRGDLTALTDDIEAVLQVPRTRRIIRALAATSAEPEIAAAAQGLWATRVTVAATCIRRGRERGELPEDVDENLIATLYAGAIVLHVIERGIDPPHTWFVDLVNAVLRAAGASPQ